MVNQKVETYRQKGYLFPLNREYLQADALLTINYSLFPIPHYLLSNQTTRLTIVQTSPSERT